GNGTSNVGVMMAIGYDGSIGIPFSFKALLVADGEAGVVMFDISYPFNPTLADGDDSRYNTLGMVSDLYVDAANDRIYVADGIEGLKVVKYSYYFLMGLSWSLEGKVKFDDAIISGIDRVGSEHYEIAAGNRGFIMMRIKKPSRLANNDAFDTYYNDSDNDNNYLACEYDTDGIAYSVNSVGNGGVGSEYYSIVADGENGIVVLQDDNHIPCNLELTADYNWINFGSIVTE
ncbi:hypothetical protein, partial [Marinitoga sp. 1197]|uniref:hypothetical protein n=1 Tax=Marinitoga sp. 1197 TaxID=1428449 RepID=UPI00064111FE